jgi:hypothetical protein
MREECAWMGEGVRDEGGMERGREGGTKKKKN